MTASYTGGTWCAPCGLFHTTAREAREHAESLAGEPHARFPHQPYDFPKENPMPERHEVSVTNTVHQVVQLGRDIVLEKEDRTTRTLFFESKADAEMFVSSLADPYPDVSEVHDCADAFPTIRFKDRTRPIQVMPVGHPVLLLPADDSAQGTCDARFLLHDCRLPHGHPGVHLDPSDDFSWAR